MIYIYIYNRSVMQKQLTGSTARRISVVSLDNFPLDLTMYWCIIENTSNYNIISTYNVLHLIRC